MEILCTILRYPFLVRDPISFLNAPLAPICTNYVGGARAIKTQLFGQSFSKSSFTLKRARFGPFFKNFDPFSKISKNQPPSHLEKIPRSAPALVSLRQLNFNEMKKE